MNKYNTLDEQIVSMRLKGLIQREIAEELNITYDKVRYTLKKKGIVQTEYKRKCRHCEAEFTTDNVRKVNCSEACRRKYNRLNQGRRYTCRYCGDEYRGYIVRYNCTRECRTREVNSNAKVRETRGERLKLIVRLAKAIDPNRIAECKECGHKFYMTSKGKMYCSTRCNEKSNYVNNYVAQRYQHKCRECGKHYTDSIKASGGCSEQCKSKYTNRVRYNTRRDRLISNGDVDWSISVERLVHRDKSNCYLCNNKVDMKDFKYSEGGHFVAGNDYGSVDHLVALSKGGKHKWSNVKLAHRLCNSYKADKDILEETQLTLF